MRQSGDCGQCRGRVQGEGCNEEGYPHLQFVPRESLVVFSPSVEAPRRLLLGNIEGHPTVCWTFEPIRVHINMSLPFALSWTVSF